MSKDMSILNVMDPEYRFGLPHTSMRGRSIEVFCEKFWIMYF